MIYPRFQLLLIAVYTVITVAIFGVVLLQIERSFGGMIAMGQTIRLPADHAYFQFLDYQASSMRAGLTLAFAAGLVLSWIATLVLSHRLAGPIIRTRGYFNEIARTGETKNKLSFRKGDFFDDLPEAVNSALDRLRV